MERKLIGKCSADGCDRKLKSRGLCGACYERLRKAGALDSSALPAYSPKNSDEKVCTKCGSTRPLDSFALSRMGVTGPVYRPYCKDCGNSQSKEWYESNTESVSARRTSRYWTHREQERSRQAEWQRDNPEKNKVRVGRRRKQLTQTATLTNHEWDVILKMFNFTCFYCDAPYEHMDHFIPLSRGGTHSKENVVPACAPCNLSKKDQDPFEFLKKGTKIDW